jgi:hypothetical protein
MNNLSIEPVGKKIFLVASGLVHFRLLNSFNFNMAWKEPFPVLDELEDIVIGGSSRFFATDAQNLRDGFAG